MIFRAVFCLFLFLPALSAAETVDTIVARVGGEVVTKAELDEALKSRKLSLIQAYGEREGSALFAKYRENALEEAILQKILEAEIMRENLAANPAEIEQEYRSRLNASGMTEPEFLSYLARNGLDVSAYKKGLKREIEERRFVEKKIMPAVAVSDYDAQKEYEAHPERYGTFSKMRFTEVFLSAADFPDEKALNDTARLIHEKLHRGGASELIRKISSGAFRENGGDSGWVAAQDLKADIRGVLSALKPGETSEILKTPQGLFIFRLAAVSDPQPRPFGEVAGAIRGRINELAVQRALRRYLMGVREETYVKILK